MSIKLLISELAIRGHYVSREAYYVMNELMEVYGWRHIETQALAPWPHSLRERMREHCGDSPDIVLFWEGYDLIASAFMQLFRADFRVVVFCEDLHWFHEPMRATKMLGLSVAELILASYAPVFERFFPEVAAARRVVWVPHAASPEFLLPMNGSAENVIFLSGMINEVYPLRQRLKTVADESGLPIVVHPHPGYRCHYDHETSGDVGAGYARRIHAARAAFTDASRFRYVLSKFFEIPAAGSLLLGDETVEEELSQLGFRRREHYIPVSEATLGREIRHVLDTKNHDELDEVRRRGQQLIWERHKTSDRAKLIDHVCTAGKLKSA
jgi:hypothetical protein